MTKKKQENQEPIIKELMKKNKGGSPTLLTDEMIELVEKYIKLGVVQSKIPALVGITETTFYAWKKRGKEDSKNGIKSKYSEFSDMIKRNKDFILSFHLQNIMKIAKEGNLTASIFILKSLYPEQFSENPELRKTKTKSKTKNVESDVDEITNRLNEKL